MTGEWGLTARRVIPSVLGRNQARAPRRKAPGQMSYRNIWRKADIGSKHRRSAVPAAMPPANRVRAAPTTQRRHPTASESRHIMIREESACISARQHQHPEIVFRKGCAGFQGAWKRPGSCAHGNHRYAHEQAFTAQTGASTSIFGPAPQDGMAAAQTFAVRPDRPRKNARLSEPSDTGQHIPRHSRSCTSIAHIHHRSLTA